MLSTPASIASLIDSITAQPATPTLYIDLEGINLSRHGSISILQLLIHPQNVNHVNLIDIHTLGSAAFTTPGSDGQTLSAILASPTIPKIIFDVRNDLNALYFLFNISLRGILDLQLMENASRSASSKRFLNGLSRCIEYDAPVSQAKKMVWKSVKEAGARLFAPEKGGSYAVFNERPLKEGIRAYCVQDVLLLPKLHAVYWGRLGPVWRGKVEEETERRVEESKTVWYEPNGPHKALGPWR